LKQQEIEAQIARAEAQLAAITGTGLADVQVACCMGQCPSDTLLAQWLKDLGLTIIGPLSVVVHRDPRPALLLSTTSDRVLPTGFVMVDLETLAGPTLYWTHRDLNRRYQAWLGEQ
jgi:hypothetical protein